MGRAIIVSDVDFSQSGLGTVTINGVVPVFALRIKGPLAVVYEAYFYVSYYPLSTTQRGVTWSVIDGGAYATINPSTGQLFVVTGSGAAAAPVRIKATSTVDSSIFAVFDTTVTESGTQPTPVEGRRLQGFDNAYLNATKWYAGTKTYPIEDTTFFIDFICPSNRTYARSIYGGGFYDQAMIHAVMLGSAVFRIDDYKALNQSYSSSVGKRIKYTRTGGSYTIEIDGTIHNGTLGGVELSGEVDMYLFALCQNKSGTITANNIADGTQIYSAKMTKNGEDIFDLFPAEWDGVVGMWDRVSGKLIGPEDGGYFSLVDNS